MNFKQMMSRGMRRGVLAALAAAALIAGCGGGQVNEFHADRVLAFGDEYSYLTSTGRKYSVNQRIDDPDSTATPKPRIDDCAAAPLWIQYVASGFGLVFPQCNPDDVDSPKSRILAAPEARVADLIEQVDDFIAADAFTERDLATMMIGTHDILDLYAQFNGSNEADLSAQARELGRRWGEQINRVALTGAAVLVATPPDLGLSPFATAEKAAHTDTDRAALITRLLRELQTGMSLEIINDGRMIGLVFGDVYTQNMMRFPGSFGLDTTSENGVIRGTANVACLATAVLPDCTADTLVTNAGIDTWLWADNIHLSAPYHLYLGENARSRAQNNPF